MDKLKCSICGGQIEMQTDKRGICTNCGTAYSLDAMRDMLSGIKVSVTGTDEDVEQWRQLVRTYYDAGDFPEAERLVKKIMEALPNDQEASQQYYDLQTLKYMEVKNGILLQYTGKAERITIPSCVSIVDKEAFKGTEFLREVTIPGTVKELREQAFAECPQLESVVLVSSRTELGQSVFASCGNLTKVQFAADMQEISDGLFYNCTSLTCIELPAGLKRMGAEAFGRCSALKEVGIPDSVVSLGDGIFRECLALEKIVIPNSVLSVGKFAFLGCKNLTTVTLPQGLKIIEHNIFLECRCLEQVNIPDNVQKIGRGAFLECASLKYLRIPAAVQEVEESAFYRCAALSKLDITLEQIRKFKFFEQSGMGIYTRLKPREHGPLGSGEYTFYNNGPWSCPWLEEIAAQWSNSYKKHRCMYCGGKLRTKYYYRSGSELICPKCYPEKFNK